MKKDNTRDVSLEMMRALIKDENGEGGVFEPILEFVKKPENELALCFRGNDTETGKVMIYKNNHLIWELSLTSEKTPVVKISADHARFMENWKDYAIKALMDTGFRGPNDETFEELENCHGFVKEHKKKDGNTEYSLVNLQFIPSKKHKLDDSFVNNSFKILDEMQESFFDENYSSVNKPRNYLKEYYLEDGEEYYSQPQKGREKHVQQSIFLGNHYFKDGLFIYDMEFAQPAIKGVTVTNNNKPDMFGIRFNEMGKMESICMIEVKSTWGAVTDKDTGLKKHLEGMEEYLKKEKKHGKLLMDDRKEEAYRILKQYETLGLYGVKKENVGSIDAFKNLKPEIVFVLTHDAAEINRTVHREDYIDEVHIKNPTISDYLKGFKPDEKVHIGKMKCEFVVRKKGY